jgi:hypothetical protein
LTVPKKPLFWTWAAYGLVLVGIAFLPDQGVHLLIPGSVISVLLAYGSLYLDIKLIAFAGLLVIGLLALITVGFLLIPLGPHGGGAFATWLAVVAGNIPVMWTAVEIAQTLWNRESA